MLNHKRVEKILSIILEGLIYLSFLMPFVYLSQSIFPFIVGKLLYFQAVVQAMMMVYLLLLLINYKKFRPKKTLLLNWFYFYVVVLLLSAVFGVDFERSFWSNFERMTGVFVVTHFVIYSIIVSTIFNTWLKIKRAIQVLLGVSLLQMLVVGMQYIKPGVFLFPHVGGRVWGTLGNSIYIGSYFLFHIFFAFLLAFKEKKQLMQIAYIFIAFMQIYIIVHSRSSRGADLALTFGVVFIVLAYGFLSKNKKIRRGAVALVILGSVLLGGAIAFKDTPTVNKIPMVGKLVNLSFDEGTGRTRMIAWEIAWKSFKEKPVFGVGLENFYYVFNKYYNPESLRYSYYETWFDRSHSIIFDTLALGGAVGFVGYFGLFVVGGILLFRKFKDGVVDKHILIFFTLVFATYLIQNLFVFDHPGSYFLLYLSLGLLLGLLSMEKEKEEIEAKYTLTSSTFYTAIAVVMVLFMILFYSTSLKTYKAAIAIIDAERVFVGNPSAGIEMYKKAFEIHTPFDDDMRLAMAKRVIRINEAQLKANPGYKTVLLFARETMLKQVDKNTHDVYDYIVLGQIDTFLGTIDPAYLKSGDEFFERARELSPKRQQIFFSWAKLKIMAGDLEGAKNLLEEAVSFDPEIAESYWYLGLVYDRAGEHEKAWEILTKAVDKNYAWKAEQELYFLIGLGERLQKNEDLIGLYKLAIKRKNNAQLYMGLGNVYLRLGDNKKGIEAFNKAQELDPDVFKKK